VVQRLALHLCVTHANLLLTFDWNNEFARLFAALISPAFMPWHAGHSLHFPARRLFFLAAFYSFSLRLGRSFAALLLHHRHEIHPAKWGIFQDPSNAPTVHRAGVIIDVVWFSRAPSLRAGAAPKNSTTEHKQHCDFSCKYFHC